MVKEAIKEGSVLDILLPRLGRPDTADVGTVPQPLTPQETSTSPPGRQASTRTPRGQASLNPRKKDLH